MGKPKRLAKEDFILAVKQQLLREGQAKITLKNVAEQAGVTQGALYYHFKTKDQLLLSLMTDYLENIEKESEKVDQRTNQRIDSLIAYLKETEYETRIRSEQQQLLFELVSLSLHNREMKRIMGEIMRRRARELEPLLEGDEEDGRILRALLDGLFLQALFDPTFDAKKVFQRVIQIFGAKDRE